MDETKPKYDLADRTLVFSKRIIDLCRGIELDAISRPIISQIVRSSTSIGANYHEADEASSKKDFVNKLCISKKEIKETIYWLNIIKHTNRELSTEIELLLSEAKELNLIFSAIVRKSKENI